MLHEFFVVAALQTPWVRGYMLGLAGLVGLVVVALTWLLVTLMRDEWQTYRRQRQLTDEALRYAEQRALQQRIRGLVDEERRRQQLTAALHTHRSSRSGEPR